MIFGDNSRIRNSQLSLNSQPSFLPHPFLCVDTIVSSDTQELAQETGFQFKIALKK